MDLRHFTLAFDDLTYTGRGLHAPESVLAELDGTLWVSDKRDGGCVRIAPDGTQRFFGGWGGSPNGLAFDVDGSVLTANFGTHRVQRLHRDGRVETVLTAVDGQPLHRANFVFVDGQGRWWLTCSTRDPGWRVGDGLHRRDGFVALVDGRGARIVADGLDFANEARLDATGRWLYVAETAARRVVRFPVRADGSLGAREVYGPSDLGVAALVDGLAFDAAGNLWVTTVVRNGLGLITPDGDYHVVIEDVPADALAAYAAKAAAGTLVPDDEAALVGTRLRLLTSVTFGGPALRTVYVGSVGMDTLPTFRSPVPGLPLHHWR